MNVTPHEKIKKPQKKNIMSCEVVSDLKNFFFFLRFTPKKKFDPKKKNQYNQKSI